MGGLVLRGYRLPRKRRPWAWWWLVTLSDRHDSGVRITVDASRLASPPAPGEPDFRFRAGGSGGGVQ